MMLLIWVSSVTILFLGPTFVSSIADYEPPYGERLYPRPFNYEYGVEGAAGVNFYKKESQDENGNVLGEVVVNLPDGRVQKTNYNADYKDGYVADVQYTGEAKYPEEPPSSQHQHIPFIPVHLKHKPVPTHIRPIQHSVRPVQHSPRPVQHSPRPLQQLVRPIHHPVQHQIRPFQHSPRPVQHSVRPVHHVNRPLRPVTHHFAAQPRRPAHRVTYRPRQSPELKSVDIDLPETEETNDVEQIDFESVRIEEEATLPEPVMPVKDKERLVVQEDRMKDIIQRMREDQRERQRVTVPDQFEGENFGIREEEDNILIPPVVEINSQTEPTDLEFQTEAQRVLSDLQKIEDVSPVISINEKQPEEYQILAEIVKTSEKLVKLDNNENLNNFPTESIMSIKSHIIESPDHSVVPVMSIKSHVIDSPADSPNSNINLGSSEESTIPVMSIKSHVIESQDEPIVPFMSIKSHVIDSPEETVVPFMSIKSHVIESPEENTSKESIVPIMSIKSHVIESPKEEVIPIMSIKSHVIEPVEDSIVTLGSQDDSARPIMSIKSHVVHIPDETESVVPSFESLIIDESIKEKKEKKPLNIEKKKSVIDFMKKLEEMKEAKDSDLMSVKSRVIQQTSQDIDGNEIMKISSRVVPSDQEFTDEDDHVEEN